MYYSPSKTSPSRRKAMEPQFCSVLPLFGMIRCWSEWTFITHSEWKNCHPCFGTNWLSNQHQKHLVYNIQMGQLWHQMTCCFKAIEISLGHYIVGGTTHYIIAFIASLSAVEFFCLAFVLLLYTLLLKMMEYFEFLVVRTLNLCICPLNVIMLLEAVTNSYKSHYLSLVWPRINH